MAYTSRRRTFGSGCYLSPKFGPCRRSLGFVAKVANTDIRVGRAVGNTRIRCGRRCIQPAVLNLTCYRTANRHVLQHRTFMENFRGTHLADEADAYIVFVRLKLLQNKIACCSLYKQTLSCFMLQHKWNLRLFG